MRSVLASMTFAFDPVHGPEDRDRLCCADLRFAKDHAPIQVLQRVYVSKKRDTRRSVRISKKGFQSQPCSPTTGDKSLTREYIGGGAGRGFAWPVTQTTAPRNRDRSGHSLEERP